MNSISQILERKSSEIWSVSPDSTVLEAIQLMSDKNVGALLVLQDNKLCGLISERDYTRSVALKNRSSNTTAVADIMTKNVYTTHPAESIKECMALMTAKRCRHLPVTEINTLDVLGMVSIGDLVKSIIDEQKFVIDQLESYINS